MEKTVVTSFGAYGFNLYARNFLETFGRFWPKDIRLVAYVESDAPPVSEFFDDGRIFDVQPIGNVSDLGAFIDAVSYFPVMCGATARGYSIFNDARSGRATFMHAHAARQYPGKVFWLDSDIVTHAPVTHEFLDKILPDDKFCAYLGRKEIFSENGFIGFNTKHPISVPFMTAYKSLYTSGQIFLTKTGWNDCSAFDLMREAFQARYKDAFNNIGEGVIYTREAQHVFINSILGSVMDHLKGGRKSLGKSPLSDLASPRSEPYWQPDNAVSVATR